MRYSFAHVTKEALVAWVTDADRLGRVRQGHFVVRAFVAEDAATAPAMVFSASNPGTCIRANWVSPNPSRHRQDPQSIRGATDGRDASELAGIAAHAAPPSEPFRMDNIWPK